MGKSKKLTAVYALIMDLPLSIIITLLMMTLSKSLNLPGFIMMSLLAYVVTFFVNFLPCGKWGFNFAIKHAQPGTLKFGLLINAVISLVFTVILDIIMTAVGTLVIGHAPVIAFVMGTITGFIPAYVVAFIVAFIMNPIADKASRKICNEPEVQHN